MKRTHLDLFDSYQTGEMSDDDTSSFLDNIVQNVPFKNSYTSYLSSVRFLKMYGIKEEIKRIHEESTSQPYYQSYNKSLAAAASLVLLCVAIFLMYQNRSLDKPLEHYFEPYPDIVTIRGDVKDRAMLAYSNKDYYVSLSLLLASGTDSDTSILYILNCAIALEKITLEEEVLTRITEASTSSVLYQQVRWYAGLYFIKNGNTTLAREYFDQIQEGDFQFASAQELSSHISNSPSSESKENNEKGANPHN